MSINTLQPQTAHKAGERQVPAGAHFGVESSTDSSPPVTFTQSPEQIAQTTTENSASWTTYLTKEVQFTKAPEATSQTQPEAERQAILETQKILSEAAGQKAPEQTERIGGAERGTFYFQRKEAYPNFQSKEPVDRPLPRHESPFSFIRYVDFGIYARLGKGIVEIITKPNWLNKLVAEDIMGREKKKQQPLTPEQQVRQEKKSRISSFVEAYKNAAANYFTSKQLRRRVNQDRLGITGMGVEEKNRLMGETRNRSYQEVDNDYSDQQAYVGLWRERQKQIEAKKQEAMAATQKTAKAKGLADMNEAAERKTTHWSSTIN